MLSRDKHLNTYPWQHLAFYMPFSQRNVTIYLHFMSFLHIDMTHVVNCYAYWVILRAQVGAKFYMLFCLELPYSKIEHHNLHGSCPREVPLIVVKLWYIFFLLPPLGHIARTWWDNWISTIGAAGSLWSSDHVLLVWHVTLTQTF